jgi:hypothetical protein
MAAPGPRPAAGLALVAGLSLLAGQPELAYYVALGTGVWALYLAWAGQAVPRRPLALAQRLGWWGASYALGTLLAGVQILPFVEYLLQSAAWHSRGVGGAVDRAYPFRFFWTAIVPDLFGNHGRGTWWAYSGNYNESNVYCGLLPWLLAPFAALARPGRPRQIAGLLLALALAALGTTYGWPGVRDLARLIPLIGVSATARLPVLYEFALALGAALGAEALLAGAAGRFRPAIVVALGAVVAAWGIGYPLLSPYKPFQLPVGVPAAAAIMNAALGRAGLVLAASVLALGAVVLLSRARPRWTGALWAGLVALLAADLWQSHADYNPTIAPADYYPPTQATTFLRAEPGLFRVAATGWTLMPNINLLYGLADLRGYDALQPAGFSAAARQIDPGQPVGGATFERVTSPLLNLFNVRYVLVPPDEDPNYRPDIIQNHADGFTAELPGGRSAGQTFVAGADHLAQIQVFGGTYGRTLTGTVVLHLKTDPAAPDDLATVAVAGRTLPDAQWWSFAFPPIAASKGRAFYFALEGPDLPPGGSFGLGWNTGEVYTAGGRFADGQPATGDLEFRTESRPMPGPPAFVAVPGAAAPGLVVYENRQALPRAWLAHRVAVEPNGAARLARLDEPAFDAPGTALLAAPLPPDQPLPAAPPPAGSDQVMVRSYAPEAVDVDSASPAAGVLILADQELHGREATVDGAPAAILTTDHLLRGVYLPAGSHHVAFRYRPAAIWLGAGLSLLAALALAVLALRR